MGGLWVSTTRANTSTSTEAALARSSARAQASTVAPEVRTSSIRTTRRPWTSDCRSAATLNAPCTLLARCDRDSPTCCSVGRTRRSASDAHFDAGLPLDDARQRAGLVVTAAPAPPPVQRYRNQHIGLAEQFPAGARHPAAHRRRQIGAVLVFQRMHQRARDVVIAHRGAGARIGRRIGDRLHRQQAGAGIVDKGNAEPRAKRRRDERQFRPAGGADAFAVDRLAAGDAQRRQRDVEREPRAHATTRRGRRAARRADGWRWNGMVRPRRPWAKASAGSRDAQA